MVRWGSQECGKEAWETGRSISTQETIGQKRDMDWWRDIVTLNWKFDAVGEMICTSCAVDALCIAFGPG